MAVVALSSSVIIGTLGKPVKQSRIKFDPEFQQKLKQIE
jgi:hypothetical protein